MKRINRSIMLMMGLLLMSGVVAAQEVAPIDSSYWNQHYANRLAFFRAMPDHHKRIVFLGDSMTEGAKWQELFDEKRVVNRGISGDVTYGVYARLDEVIQARPLKVFLLCGVNDMKRGIATNIILANIERIVQRIKRESPKTRLFVQGLLPVNESMLPAAYGQVTNAKISTLNTGLSALCTAYDVDFINLHPVFADAQGRMRGELVIDGLHLKQASYILWANYLKSSNVM